MRATRLLIAPALIATGVVVVPGPPPAVGATTSECRLVERVETTADGPASVAVLSVTLVSDDDGQGDRLAFSTGARPPGATDHRPLVVTVDDETLECGTATVSTVDVVDVRAAAAVDPLTLVIDLGNGPFAPGADPAFDPFRPALSEDRAPEIEFDVHAPFKGAIPLTGRNVGPGVALEVLGSEGADHVVFGSTTCPDDAGPACRPVKLNLNGGGDDDADVMIAFGEADAAEGVLSGVGVTAGGGNDVVDARGGAGTGRPFDSTARAPDTFVVDGGPGDDTIYGTAYDRRPGDPADPDFRDEVLLGGSGDDTIIGGGGDDGIDAGSGDDTIDAGDDDDTVDAGSGDDAIDEGFALNGSDLLRSGDGARDVVDYSKRSGAVSAAPGDNEAPFTDDPEDLADDGELSERDTVDVSAEDVLLPGDTEGGLEVVGTLPALRGCAHPTSPKFDLAAEDQFGPCPMLVDTERNLGFSVGYKFVPGGGAYSGDPRLFVYDLERLGPPREIPCTDVCLTALGFGALDPIRTRLYLRPTLWAGGDVFTTGGEPIARNPCALPVLDYSDLDALAVKVRHYDCPAESANFVSLAVASVPGESTLYLSGAPKDEFAVRRNNQNFAAGSFNSLLDWTTENLGQPLLVRSVALGDDRLGTPDVEEMGTFEWDLDLRGAGCGRRAQPTGSDPVIPPFVTRMGSDLLAYCWDARFVYWNGSNVSGPQGYVVRIPLDPATGRPLGLDGEPLEPSARAYTAFRFVRTPTLPGYVHIVADHASGLLALVTGGRVNGNAVWLFDPRSDRFVGVVTGGAAAQPANNTAVGLDALRGRAYLLTQDGVLVAPTRQRPLPAGVIYPAGQNAGGHRDWANFPTIPVAPQLRRLFLPINLPGQVEAGPRYLVVEDQIPEPPAPLPLEPDRNTTQVDEGHHTEVSATAAASASGAHAVVVGGVTRTIDSADPACATAVPVSDSQTVTARLYGGGIESSGEIIEDADIPLPSLFAGGECLSAQMVAGGHREFSLSATEAEAGAASVARGAPLDFAEGDVTTNDLKARGACEIATLQTLTRGNLPASFTDPYGEGCDGLWDFATARRTAGDGSRSDDPASFNRAGRDVPDPRDGTRGRDGRGAPIPAAACADFGSSPMAPGPEGREPLYHSAAACDHSATAATAAASTAGFSLSRGTFPVLTVTSTSSSVTTARTSEGQVTTAAARAEGVAIGPLVIREIRAVAVTRARGRTGTAEATLERRWCGLSLIDEAAAGLPEEVALHVEAVRAALTPQSRALYRQGAACIDPAHPDNAALIESLNGLLLGKVRLSVTAPNEEVEPDGTTEAGEDSPGGYQAVLIKHQDARGGDSVVNDDDSITVAALEAVVYNDGIRGRNRYVVQLAGVHVESRYGITLLPQFAGFDGSFSAGSFEPTPGARRVIPGTRRLPSASTIIEGGGFEELFSSAPLPENPVRRFLGFLPEALGDLWRLFVQHPLEFLLLFFVFSLLGTPAYLAYRRRTFVGVVAPEG